jgi:rhomboid family GlyGly-CTERM serine protease
VNRFPVITLSALLPAFICASWPEAASVLIYQRDAIVAGEWWRIITGNWVHLSANHFAYDVMVFALAGSLIELRGHRGFGWFCVLSPALIGLTVFLAEPGLELFGGLSGMATGAIVLLCLNGLGERNTWSLICSCVLVAVVLKTIFEFATGQMAFVHSGSTLLKPIPISHLAGALAAALVFMGQPLPHKYGAPKHH